MGQEVRILHKSSDLVSTPTLQVGPLSASGEGSDLCKMVTSVPERSLSLIEYFPLVGCDLPCLQAIGTPGSFSKMTLCAFSLEGAQLGVAGF